MFNWLMTTTTYERDFYILEVLLSRYLVAYIQKKEFDVNILSRHWSGIVMGRSWLYLFRHYNQISGTTYGKILFEKCEGSLPKFFELIEETKGRI